MIQLVSDSTSDLPKELIEKYNITTVPLTINIDGEEYIEGIDISSEEFANKMEKARNLPKTSMPSPAAFSKVFNDLSKKGPVLCITLSSKLSGTYQSACLGKDDHEGDIRVIDSLAASIATGLQLIEARELIDQGKDINEIEAYIRDMTKRSKIFILLNTLENIVKGGRLGKFQGSLANLLNIKVITHGVDGEVEILERIRGKKKFLNRTIELIGESKDDFSDTVFGITHVNNLKDAEYIKNEIIEKYNPEDIIINNMGSTIATYAGKDGIIVSYY